MSNKKITVKRYIIIALPLLTSLLILLGSITITVFNGSFSNTIENTNKGLLYGLYSILIITGISAICVYKSKKLQYIFNNFINILKIEDSLISLGIYEPINNNIVRVPKVKIMEDKKTIYISLSNPLFRAKLENYNNVLSTALPNEWIIDNTYLNIEQDTLVIEYFDTSQNNKNIINTPEQFIRMQKCLRLHQIQIMPNSVFDIKKTPHLLVTGSTNGGKSYFVLNNIVASALIKNWKVTVLDYKSQYHILDGVCNTAYTVEDILKVLRLIKSEMNDRKKALEPILRTEFSAVAYEHGFPIHLVIIEEYFALLTSGLKKEVKNEIEEIILNLAVLSRSLGFCLCLITQQSGSYVIPTALRSQLQFRLLLGSPSQSIYECTFEDKSKPNINISLPIGCGLYCNDGVNIRLFRGFTFNYDVVELFRLLSCKNK